MKVSPINNIINPNDMQYDDYGHSYDSDYWIANSSGIRDSGDDSSVYLVDNRERIEVIGAYVQPDMY